MSKEILDKILSKVLDIESRLDDFVTKDQFESGTGNVITPLTDLRNFTKHLIKK